MTIQHNPISSGQHFFTFRHRFEQRIPEASGGPITLFCFTSNTRSGQLSMRIQQIGLEPQRTAEVAEIRPKRALMLRRVASQISEEKDS